MDNESRAKLINSLEELGYVRVKANYEAKVIWQGNKRQKVHEWLLQKDEEEKRDGRSQEERGVRAAEKANELAVEANRTAGEANTTARWAIRFSILSIVIAALTYFFK